MLDNIAAAIKAGHTTCIMGPSGIGKTTFLNIMMGLAKADSGEVLNIPEKKSAVFQENRLCEDFSVMTNIKMVNDSLTEDLILSHLEKVGLRENARQKVSSLSGGMKRRTALVRAVLAQKDIIFLDEPFKGLDEDTAKKAALYLAENTKNITVIAVTHQKQDAVMLNADILYFEDGKVYYKQ